MLDHVSDRIERSDALRQFCRHAFELRDWLSAFDIDQPAKDEVSHLFGKPPKDPAERIPPKSMALAACADIANRSKRNELSGPSYSEGGHADITHEGMSSMSDLPEFARQYNDDVPRIGDHQWMWIIPIDGTEYDALLLADDRLDDLSRQPCTSGVAPERVVRPPSQPASSDRRGRTRPTEDVCDESG